MIRRLVTASILIPAVLALIFVAPLWVYLLAVEFFLLASLWELLRLFPTQSARGYWVLYPLAAASPWLWCYADGVWFGPYLLLCSLTILTWSVAGGGDVKQGFASSAGNLMAFFYLAVPFSIIGGFHPNSASGPADPSRGLELAWIFAIIWIADGGAYFVGRAFGRHKISPRISPNKSLEGFVAAVFLGALGGALLGRLLLAWSWTFVASAGALLAVSGIYGDLFESLLKRSGGVKDTSNLIPGHGGVLDRVDSLLFAVPVYHLLRWVVKMWPTS